MKRIIILIAVLSCRIANGQNLRDTIDRLKDYSHNYLEYLFNKRDIDAAMRYWDEGMFSQLKSDYSGHRQQCKTDSLMKVFFKDDMNKFYGRVQGKIDFFACDDKEGINIVYRHGQDQDPGYLF